MVIQRKENRKNTLLVVGVLEDVLCRNVTDKIPRPCAQIVKDRMTTSSECLVRNKKIDILQIQRRHKVDR